MDDQQEAIYNISVAIQDVVWKSCWEQWTIETGGERGLRRSVLPCHMMMMIIIILEYS